MAVVRPNTDTSTKLISYH